MRALAVGMALLVAAGLAGCGGDGTGPDQEVPEALVGRWAADQGCSPGCSFTLTWTENAAARFDVVSGLGMSVAVEITRAGRFTLDFSGGAAPEAGTVRVAGGTMIVRDSRGVEDTIDYRIEGQNLLLELRRLYHDLDFNADGIKDPARASAVLQKR